MKKNEHNFCTFTLTMSALDLKPGCNILIGNVDNYMVHISVY
jgi:hypothetical protein